MILGIEIGGTKLQLGVGTGRTTDIAQGVRLDVDRPSGAQGILAQIKSHAPTLIAKHGVTSVGIGFGGPVNSVDKTTITSHHVAGWENVALGSWCQSELGVPVEIDNDCNVAALAEATLGAGSGMRRVFYVTVGTGIGGGLVVDGKIYGNDRPAAAEIGHLRPGVTAIDPHETVESFASGSGIENRLRHRLNELAAEHAQRTELLGMCNNEIQNLSAKRIATAWAAGNPIAAETMHVATRTLGWAIAQVATITCPEVVVIGGGVSLIGTTFVNAVREAFEIYLFPPLHGAIKIRPAKLGESVVVHGAILLAR